MSSKIVNIMCFITWHFFCFVLFCCVFLRYAGFSLLWPLPLRSAGSAAMAHGPSSSAECGIFPDRGTNPCPLKRQADSQPLRHQGSPGISDFSNLYFRNISSSLKKHIQEVSTVYISDMLGITHQM